MKNKLIYIATPYTHNNKNVREGRFKFVTEFSALLSTQGIVNFSPITHSHTQAEMFEIPTSWDFWKHTDLTFLDRCDELWVLVQPGWKESVGVTAEIAYMESLGKPVKYVTMRRPRRPGEKHEWKEIECRNLNI